MKTWGMLMHPSVNPPIETGLCWGANCKNKASHRLISLGHFEDSDVLTSLLCEQCLKREFRERGRRNAEDLEELGVIVMPLQITEFEGELLEEVAKELRGGCCERASIEG